MLSHLTNILGGFGNVHLFSRLSAKSLASTRLITATQNLFVASLGSSLFGASMLMTEERNQRYPELKNIGILWRQPHIDLSQGIKKIIEATAALNKDLLRDKQHYYLSLNEVIRRDSKNDNRKDKCFIYG